MEPVGEGTAAAGRREGARTTRPRAGQRVRAHAEGRKRLCEIDDRDQRSGRLRRVQAFSGFPHRDGAVVDTTLVDVPRTRSWANKFHESLAILTDGLLDDCPRHINRDDSATRQWLKDLHQPLQSDSGKWAVQTRSLLHQNALLMYSNPEMYRDQLEKADGQLDRGPPRSDSYPSLSPADMWYRIHRMSGRLSMCSCIGKQHSHPLLDRLRASEQVPESERRARVKQHAVTASFLHLVYAFRHEAEQGREWLYVGVRDIRAFDSGRKWDSGIARGSWSHWGLETSYEEDVDYYQEVRDWQAEDAQLFGRRRWSVVMVAVFLLLLSWLGIGLTAYLSWGATDQTSSAVLTSIILVAVGLALVTLVQVCTSVLRLWVLITRSEDIADGLYQRYTVRRSRQMAAVVNAWRILRDFLGRDPPDQAAPPTGKHQHDVEEADPRAPRR
jgi:hypothetical protein